MDRRRQLKIKIKSLAAESRFIRHEERQTAGEVRRELYLHRIQIVRQVARTSLIAYAFLRGRPYRQVEQRSATRPDWNAVEKTVQRFGVAFTTAQQQNDQLARLRQWIEGINQIVEKSVAA